MNNIIIDRYSEDILNRPRVSYKISEYVWDYIYANLLVKNKILTNNKFRYRFFLTFDKLNLDKKYFFRESLYNFNEETKFSSEPQFRTRKDLKSANLGILSTLIGPEISPIDYSNIVYDAFGSFLIINFKKVTKDSLDALKENLDYGLIKNFPYPAPFEDQKYAIDESIIDGVVIKDMYLEKWKF